jgi:hypothetical protein
MKVSTDAKAVLNTLIEGDGVFCFQSLLIAELLRRDRIKGDVDFSNPSSFHASFHHWREKICPSLLGRSPTVKWYEVRGQFSGEIINTPVLAELGTINRRDGGAVEAHIYEKLSMLLAKVNAAGGALAVPSKSRRTVERFLTDFHGPELRCELGRAYEVLAAAIVWAFSHYLKQQGWDKAEDLALNVPLGLRLPLRLFRLATLGATDDPRLRIRHVCLSADRLPDCVPLGPRDQLLVICNAEQMLPITLILKQMRLLEPDGGVVCTSELLEWCALCFGRGRAATLGKSVIQAMSREFLRVFPVASNDDVHRFLSGRGYQH